MARRKGKSLESIMADDGAITAALARAVRGALKRHQEAGIPAVEWRDGNIVRVPVNRLPLDDKSKRSNGTRRGRRT
jgi:hypothetical protein